MQSNCALLDEPPKRELEFSSAFALVYDDRVVTIFKADGSSSEFWPPLTKRSFVWAAIEMGYRHDNGGILRYGIEHDITHHWLADEMGWPHSYSIWGAAHAKPGNSDLPMEKWSDRVKYEEHMVNRLQKYINTGEKDDDYGCLDRTFGHALPRKALDLTLLLRPWLSR
jgi:hypothetical protein